MVLHNFRQWGKNRQLRKWKEIDEKNKEISPKYEKRLDHRGKSIEHFFKFNHRKTRPE